MKRSIRRVLLALIVVVSFHDAVASAAIASQPAQPVAAADSPASASLAVVHACHVAAHLTAGLLTAVAVPTGRSPGVLLPPYRRRAHNIAILPATPPPVV